MMRKWCDTDSNCDNDAFSYDSTREEEEDCLSIGSRWSASFLPNIVLLILMGIILIYLYHLYHNLNCWLWLCNFQAQFWCWRSRRIDYHNYLTIWPCQIFRLSQLSDALCQIYRLTNEQQFDSTLSKHLFWLHGKMHGKIKCWLQPFDAIGRTIWRSQLQ